ncbi:MAG: metallophosphoesterase [Bacteroidales bacterium]|nr:metallophosphoesterase [Bacteroidales bacterium]
MKNIAIFLIMWVLIMMSCSPEMERPDLRIGLIADQQYEFKETIGERHYKESLSKLGQAIDTLNAEQVDFVQNLGDLVNGQWASYDSVLPIFDKLNSDIDNYFLLGNHEFSIDSVDKLRLLEKLSMPNFYYSYVKKNWRFLVLDATDMSYYANVLHQRDSSEIEAVFNLSQGQENHNDWNGGIGKEQQAWMKSEFEKAMNLNQQVILFSHMPLIPLNMTSLWNYKEIVALIETCPNIVAYINGHRHEGGYAYSNGVHYINIYGMLDTSVGSYAILDISGDSLIINGYGNQMDMRLKAHTKNEAIGEY